MAQLAHCVLRSIGFAPNFWWQNDPVIVVIIIALYFFCDPHNYYVSHFREGEEQSVFFRSVVLRPRLLVLLKGGAIFSPCYFLLFWASGFFLVRLEGRCYFFCAILGSSSH